MLSHSNKLCKPRHCLPCAGCPTPQPVKHCGKGQFLGPNWVFSVRAPARLHHALPLLPVRGAMLLQMKAPSQSLLHPCMN